MTVIGLVYFLTPLAVLVGAGAITAGHLRPQVWARVAVLALVSTAVWLVYAGLYEHENPCGINTFDCPTVYGTEPVLPEEHPAGLVLLLAGFALPAAWAGWRGGTPPLTAGAALALGPTLLALSTAPRGDNDGLWALILWMLPALGGLAAVVVMVAERIGAVHRAPRSQPVVLTVATISDRLAALAIDVAAIGTVLVIPLTMLSHGGREVAAVIVGIAVASAYFAVPLARKGRTLGQSLVGLIVIDSRTHSPPSIGRALIRSVVVVVEVAGVPTLILAAPAFVELLMASSSGRSLTDRLLKTLVLSDRRPAATPHPASPV